MNDWEKCYSRNGCPYYLNCKTMKSQWEHPYFVKVLADAADYNDVIYAAYRTALKLLYIRNKMHLYSLDVDTISCAFSEVVPLNGVRVDEYLTLTQLNEIVARLYIYSDSPLNQSVWMAAMSSCVLYFFDGKKRGTVNTLSALVFVTMLCSDKLTNKYSFIFECLSQHDLVGAQDISHLKKTVFTILTRLQEDKAYKHTYEGNGTTMTKDMFLKWLLTEPKFIVWLSTMHRIHAAVSVTHTNAKCYSCKDVPIVGLRYRCLQCFNVDMCFQCFTRIPAYGKHDKSHAIEEYCLQSNKMQDMKAFITKLRNNVKKKSKHSKSSSDCEFDLTARRHPATVWHDPRLSEPGYYRPSPDIDVRTDILAPNPYTPIHSPITDDRKSRQSSKTSVYDGYHSLTRGYSVAPRTKGEIRRNQSDRYCQSLPRRAKPRPSIQSPDRGLNPGVLPVNHSNQPPTRRDNRHSHPNCSTPYKITDADCVKEVSAFSDIKTPQCEPATAPHSVARFQYNRNRELYAPSSRPTTNQNGTLELDFYSSSTRKAVPYNPSNNQTYNYSQQQNTTQNYAHNSIRTHNNVCSEDEGIVVNSESDSSVSQFAAYENRESYMVPGQPSQSIYSDNYSRYSRPMASQVGSAAPFEYSRYTRNGTKPEGSNNYDRCNDKSTYRVIDSNNTGEPTGYTAYQGRLIQAVDGIESGLSPIVRAYQV